MNSSFFLGSVAAAIGFFTLLKKFRFQQDTKSTSLSLPSPSTSVSRNWKHHVFPSFHGPDVRRTFLSHILVVFRGKGIDPFIDNHIPRSKSIGPEIREAIKGSKIAIVLLSRKYASSSWCLDELVEIMKCREVLGQRVMTIFYEVDPTDIKKQTGDFGKAFRKTCKDKTKEHIERWRKALEDVAFQIFCMHAFGQKHPHDGFFELAWEVTYLAGKLPLGLKVLGSALRGMSKQEWKRTLPRLKTQLVGDTESILKFSYDALRDDDKDLFLYIACLFMDSFYFLTTHKVEEVLANKFLDVRQGLHVLAQKSLISIDNEVIHMHTLLKQFGRETSRKQFLHGFAKHQLLVNARDICQVLSDDTTDCRRFIGINLDLSETEEELNISEKALGRMSNLQFVRINGNNLPHPERLHSLLYNSQNIRLLDWKQWEGTKISNFNPEFLVELKMRYSKLEKLWEGTKPLRNLKWMDLSYSRYLKELPDLSTATKLEELILSNCSSLVELPSSTENATYLWILDLFGCSNLLQLPSFGNLNKLERLILYNCSRVVELPALENATNLQALDLRNCSSLQELPPSIGTATNLQELDISGCSSLVKLPSSIGDLTNLELFYLGNCSSLVELPSSIGNLQQLFRLRMRGCSKIEALPTNINLESLTELDLTNCSKLKSFPEISTNIECLKLRGTAIKEVPLSIMSWSQFSDFQMSYFEGLKEFPHAFDIITELDLVNEDIKEVPPWVKGMSRLRKLRLYNCDNLVLFFLEYACESLLDSITVEKVLVDEHYESFRDGIDGGDKEIYKKNKHSEDREGRRMRRKNLKIHCFGLLKFANSEDPPTFLVCLF